MRLRVLQRFVFGMAACCWALGVQFVASAEQDTASWFIAPTGDDSHSCSSPADACASIAGALAKASAGDTAYVAVGTYTGGSGEVVLLTQSVTLSGGWDADFANQIGMSTVDGGKARRGMTVTGGTVVIERFIVQNGVSSSDYGGGIHNAGGTVTLNHCAIRNNSAAGGGGIWNSTAGGTINLNNSAIDHNNSDSRGGGIWSYGGSVTLNNCTVAHNYAGRGGGIATEGTGTGLFLNNTTVSANLVAFEGSGIAGAGITITLHNSIVAANGPDGGGGDCVGLVESRGYNLLGDTSGCPGFTPAAGDLTGVAAGLGVLVGGPGYIPLLGSSAARDAADPAGCSGSMGLLLTDQRGAARVGRCDIGAYEYTLPAAAATISVYDGAPQDASPGGQFGIPLRVLVMDALGTPVPDVRVDFTAPAGGPSGVFSDTGTITTTARSAETGIATAAMFTANDVAGSYVVTATTEGAAIPAFFTLSNTLWYVSPAGNDANDCRSPTTACRSIDEAVVRSQTVDGEVIILVAEGSYTGGFRGVLLERTATLRGGWDETFTAQTGLATIGGYGRGVWVGPSAKVQMDGFFIRNCSSDSGGGIHVYNTGHLTLSNSTLSSNFSNQGAAIRNSGTLTMTHCIVEHNTSSRGGGGLYNDGGTMIVDHTVVRNNSTAYMDAYDNGGGGILNYGGTVLLTNSSLTNNSTLGPGGGICSLGGSVILNNSTVNGNSAAKNGGGIYNYSTAILSLNSSTISSNRSSAAGGGVANSGAVAVQNSLLAMNSAATGPDCTGTGIQSAGFNLVGSTSGCTFASATGDLLNVDPSLAVIGGLGYVPLFPRSRAIDAGNPGGCRDHLSQLLGSDQRGVIRVGRCDIGAYEYTAEPGPAATLFLYGGTPQSAMIGVGFREPLRLLAVDALGNLANGDSVTFAAPASGASAVFADSGAFSITVTTDGGLAQSGRLTANLTVGSYAVTATSGADAAPVYFELTNQAMTLALSLVMRRSCPFYFDDFGDPFSGWPAGEDEYVRVEYLHHEYRVLSKKAGYLFLFQAPLCCVQNYVLEVDARWDRSVATGSSYGLIFGIVGDLERYYLVEVNSDFQGYALYRREPGGFVEIASPEFSGAIAHLMGRNHLKVIRDGTQITLEVNGTVLGTWNDGAILTAGGVGLAAASYLDKAEADARFDNFSMWSLGYSGVAAPTWGLVPGNWQARSVPLERAAANPVGREWGGDLQRWPADHGPAEQ